MSIQSTEKMNAPPPVSPQAAAKIGAEKIKQIVTAELLHMVATAPLVNTAPSTQENSDDWSERNSSLEQRLAAFIRSMPESERTTPRPLSFYQDRLKGRSKGKPAHPGDIGKALRALGFTRVRNWHNGRTNGFRALWVPSGEGKFNGPRP